MPLTELLGIQIDMQLLLKLSAAVAAVLLVSWAYRFYSSRNEDKVQLGVKDSKGTRNATCQKCKTSLRRRRSPEHGADDGDKRAGPRGARPAADDLTPDSAKATPATLLCRAGKSTDAFSVSYQDEDNIKGASAEVATSNISFGSALNCPHPTEGGMTAATGRRSPCFLQKLEGIVGVGRELRQDLEHQGAYSSFCSKAEIKVEDANVVLDGTEDPIVHGKIYDYYVESLSHSIKDPNVALGQYERNSDMQPVVFGGHSGSLAQSPSSRSPLMINDIFFPQSTVEASGNLKLEHPTGSAHLRKQSYLSAAEQSELPFDFETSIGPTPTTDALDSTADDSVTVSPVDLNVNEGSDLETVAGAPFLHLPAKPLRGKDLESLKLDLGNCLEVLYLAKKHGQICVQQAALGVMSDNYLQVIRDCNLYGRLMAAEREQIRKQRAKGRRFVMVADMDPQDWSRSVHGQTEHRRAFSAMYCYDDYKNSWQTFCQIPQEVITKACAMCTMDNYLFVAVGCQGTDTAMAPSNRVFCYNPLTSIWKEISPMNEARPRCKLAALGGCIYAIGGECLSSVERYDPRLDRWTFVAPLPNDTFAVAHHVTVCNGEIFVSGGSLRYLLLRYSPKTNTWKQSLLAVGKDRTADMVAVGSFLYRFDVNPLLGVSVYRYHTVARLWYECSSRRLSHCPAFQCVAVENIIYCISHQFTMKFEADEISPAFRDEDLRVLSAAKGIFFPFVLSLPDKRPRQTSV